MIRIFQPSLGNEELHAIAEVFNDQWPGAGPRVKQFEKAFAEYLNVPVTQLIAVTSCTEGTFQSVAALELDPTDEVILPTISFIGAAHAVRAAGAVLRLSDVDHLTLNPRPEHLLKVITPRTKAILLLHFGGRLDWIPDIVELATKRGIVLIEDAACALGGMCRGVPYGTFGDVGVWSFDAMKLLVTGDGGMIRVSDERLRKKIFNRVNLGGVRPGFDEAKGKPGRWWEINPESWGRLAFMNDLAAAIGLVQLRRIDGFIQRRREIARIYDDNFRSTPWLTVPPPPNSESVPYFYWIQTSSGMRDRLASFLRERDIYTTFRYWPLHRTSLYADSVRYPGADRASDTTLLLPLHQNLSNADVKHVVKTVVDFGSSHSVHRQ